MSNHFDAFLMTVMVILTLMLIEMAGGACYHELKRQRSAGAFDGRTRVPAVQGQIAAGMVR